MLIRPAAGSDAAGVTAVQLRSRAAAPMPAGIHSEAEVRAFLTGRIETDEVWIAEVAGEVVGYVRWTPTWLDDLYVLPEHAGQGVGTALLDLVKAQHPDGFGLWVFEMNTPARAFYARHGLVEVEHTDGSDNEEQAPDVRMSWRPAEVVGEPR